MTDIEDRQPRLNPDELLQRMATAASIFERANQERASMEMEMTRRTERTRIIILAKRLDLLQNERLRAHLEMIFTPNDEGKIHKLTIDDIEACINQEVGEFAERYNAFAEDAKQAEKEHEIWGRQLSWHQSVLKRESAELMSLNLVNEGNQGGSDW